MNVLWDLVSIILNLASIAGAILLLWYVFVQEPRLLRRIDELERAERIRRFWP